MFDKDVPVGGEVLDEEVVSDATGLFKPRYTLFDFNIHKAICLNPVDIIL